MGRPGWRAILLSMTAVITSLGPAAAAAGAGPERAVQAVPATLTVTPASEVSVGDTITLDGAGFAPASDTLSQGVWVYGCRAGIAVGAGREELQDRCSGEFNGTSVPPEGGGFTTSLRVTAPWDVVVAVRQEISSSDLVVEAVGPVSVTHPDEPTITFTSIANGTVIPDPLLVTGWAYPSPGWGGVEVRGCPDAVLDDPTDFTLVQATCSGSDNVTYGDGSFVTTGTFQAREGWTVIWAGEPFVDPELVTTAPVTLKPPRTPLRVTVRPAQRLHDGQTVHVTATGFPDVGGEVFAVHQCERAALDEIIDRWPTMRHCSPIALFGDYKHGDTFSGDGVVEDEITIDDFPFPRTVRCDTAPGACVLVVANPVTADVWAAGGAPISFARPTVAPLATLVVERASGTATAEVPVVLSAATSTPVTVRYTTLAGLPGWRGLATPGRDYVATAGTLTLPPGATTASIPVEVLADALAEPPEVILVRLTGASGATIGGFGGIGGVVIIDAPPS
jgi:hypothetical protein